jgi:hypothetical protein
MAKATIFGRGLDSLEIEGLLSLLAETGSCEGPVDVTEAITAVGQEHEDAVILLLGTPGTCADNELEANLAQIPASMQRAIWVWPKNSTESNAPPAARKYCYSIVSWNANKLRAVVADDDVTCFEKPDGIPMPKVDTERNLCVDEDEDTETKAK